MAKKQRSKPKKDKTQVKAEPPKPDANPEEKPFDFGGLPERDLKKNLGCG
jgi:hypothetical protein